MPANTTMAATMNDQAPIVCDDMPATIGNMPPKVPRRPMSTRISATMIVGMRGAKFMRPPMRQIPGNREPMMSSTSPANRNSHATSTVTSMSVPNVD